MLILTVFKLNSWTSTKIPVILCDFNMHTYNTVIFSAKTISSPYDEINFFWV